MSVFVCTCSLRAFMICVCICVYVCACVCVCMCVCVCLCVCVCVCLGTRAYVCVASIHLDAEYSKFIVSRSPLLTNLENIFSKIVLNDLDHLSKRK